MSIMLMLPSAMWAQATQTVRGQVFDVASGEPMIGVTITVENGTTMTAVTDANGCFEINNVPTFQGQTFNLRTHEPVEQFTSLTFPNIAYRVEF